MWYLLGARASEEEPTTGLPWVAAVANKVAAEAGAAGATTAAVVGATGGSATEAAGAAGGAAEGGGEELRTLGRKA